MKYLLSNWYKNKEVQKEIEDQTKKDEVVEKELADMLRLHSITVEERFGGLLVKLSEATAALHMIWQSRLKPHLIGLEFYVKHSNGGYSCTHMCSFPPPLLDTQREKMFISILAFIDREWWSDHMLILVGED